MEAVGITGVLFGLYRGLYWENLDCLPNKTPPFGLSLESRFDAGIPWECTLSCSQLGFV